MTLFRVYLVTDRGTCKDLVATARAALSALPSGTAAVQLREKDLAGGELFRLARALLPVCSERGARLLINDRADVALATGAHGVHLPAAGLPIADARRLLGPRATIGASCHSVDELRNAQAAGADFAVYGPIWATPGKGPALGLEALRAAIAAVSMPVFALGGVDASNARAALHAGARGVACIRAVLGAADPRAAAARLWSAVEPA
jgi:thiamine-phosphate pyrophosphorylase